MEDNYSQILLIGVKLYLLFNVQRQNEKNPHE